MKHRNIVCLLCLIPLIVVVLVGKNLTLESVRIVEGRSIINTTPSVADVEMIFSQSQAFRNLRFTYSDYSNENEKIHLPESTSVTHYTTSTMESVPLDSRFSIGEHFSFPHPGGALKNTTQLLDSVWVNELKLILQRWNPSNRMIIMVSSNYQYIEVLLNWLISSVVVAKLNLNSILVISLDEKIHLLLQARGICSLLVIPSSLFEQHVTPSLWMTRLVLIRLLSHWGFDVAHFDADALIIQYPEPLFNQFNDSGIIGSQGSFPSALNHKWGATLCAGVMVIKSSKETEDYWETMSKILRKSLSDQERLNYALESLHIEWHRNGEIFEGQCTANKLRVTLLPQSYVCRSNCKQSKLKSYYVWHKTGQKNSESKRRAALDGRLWYLRDNWSTQCSSEELKKLEWLECIALL